MSLTMEIFPKAMVARVDIDRAHDFIHFDESAISPC